MSEDVKVKTQQEKETLEFMVGLFCRKNRHSTCKGFLCTACRELTDYCFERIDLCPFSETKTFCSGCRVHCYREDMRTRIREVMRFSGPRMIMYHPVMAFRHLKSMKSRKK